MQRRVFRPLVLPVGRGATLPEHLPVILTRMVEVSIVRKIRFVESLCWNNSYLLGADALHFTELLDNGLADCRFPATAAPRHSD